MNIDESSNNTSKRFHTNGYADVLHQGPAAIPSFRVFQQRSIIDRSRRSTRTYRNSHAGRGYMGEIQRQLDVVRPVIVPQPRENMVSNPIKPVRTSFIEPPARHNPYA
jgi:hypothetical protein